MALKKNPETEPVRVRVDGTRVFSHDEDLRVWRDEYERVMEAMTAGMSKGNGEETRNGIGGEGDEPLPAGAERRKNPRYSLRDGSRIYAHLGPKAFQIIDISIGGVAFYSDVVFEVGTRLLMSALGMIALDVEVVSCEMEEINADLMEYSYRVHCRFGPRVNGYQVYVLAREMHLSQLEGAEAAEELDE